MKRRLVFLFLVFAAIVGLFLLPLGPLFENVFYNFKARLFAHRIDPDVVLVDIDQESLDFYRSHFNLSWPWPRSLYGRAIDFLNRAGARAIGLDVLFSEPYLYPEEDQRLAESMKRAGSVFLPFFLSRDENAQAAIERFSLPSPSTQARPDYPGVTASIPMLLEAQRGGGNARFSSDPDSVFRRMPHFFSHRGRVYPSLALAIALYLKPSLDIRRIPLGRSLGTLVFFYDNRSFARYSISQLIQSEVRLEEGKGPVVNPEDFRGKVVLVGSSATGLRDVRPTPLKRNGAGFELLAISLQNILRYDFIREAPPAVVWLLVLVLIAATGLLQERVHFPAWYWQVLFSFGFLVVVAGLDLLAHGLLHLEIPFFPLAAAVILTSAIEVYYRTHLLGKEKKKIQTAFEFYLSDSLLKKVLKNPEALHLGGEKRKLTIFFSDLAGFTSISERLAPAEVVDLLNTYLERMTSIILDLEGYVDKFEGDAVMAFWGAPVEILQPATKALRAALRSLRDLSLLNVQLQERGMPDLEMRVGINSGDVIVGNVGSKKKINYTVIGDPVNLASRLEGLNKQYDTHIICGSTTRDWDNGQVVFRRLDRVRVKGKALAEEVFEVVGEKEECSSSILERIARFEEALELYFSGHFGEASRIWESLEGDPPSRVFLNRCHHLMEHPPLEWDGVWTYSHK